MEEILYVKIEQNIPVKKRTLTFQDIASLYCTNKKIVQKLEKEIFYTLPERGSQKTMFTIGKVYEGIHKIYPNLQIENMGEQDFIVDLEMPDKKEKGKTAEYAKTILTALIIFFGAVFTIMTFNEDVSVHKVFDKVYEMVMGTAKTGGSVLEFCYALGLPVGILVFYNHFRRRKRKNDPTPIQVEMRAYEEQVNKAMIATASREGKTIDVN
ncbi:MAG: stage V sporulation protein AA [Lachnospiraceae bacterium]|nr:stage V sporulation protein AA [Lachnospiraceae bacterium]